MITTNTYMTGGWVIELSLLSSFLGGKNSLYCNSTTSLSVAVCCCVVVVVVVYNLDDDVRRLYKLDDNDILLLLSVELSIDCTTPTPTLCEEKAFGIPRLEIIEEENADTTLWYDCILSDNMNRITAVDCWRLLMALLLCVVVVVVVLIMVACGLW